MSDALKAAKHTNAGLRDQIVAFECEHVDMLNESMALTLQQNTGVRDNIAAFGGDPDNVIAIGQSVGANAIGMHIVSYEGKRGVPFQKAM